MATPRPPKVVLRERERTDLERLVRAYTTAGDVAVLRLALRLASGAGSPPVRWVTTCVVRVSALTRVMPAT